MFTGFTRVCLVRPLIGETTFNYGHTQTHSPTHTQTEKIVDPINRARLMSLLSVSRRSGSVHPPLAREAPAGKFTQPASASAGKFDALWVA